MAWPSIRGEFRLPLDALGLLLVAQTAGYVASSFANGALLARMSVGALLALSCLATAGSLLGYAITPSYGPMVVLGIGAGLGAGAVDAALNTYVARHHSGRVLSLMHAFYGLGTTAGPAIMTSVLVSGLAWQRGYFGIGAAQVALATCFAATLRLWPGSEPASIGPAVAAAPLTRTLGLRAARLGAATFFLYVGIEASAGAWLFTLLSGSRGASMAAAGTAASIFWAGLMVGRLALALFPLSGSPSVLVGPCILTGVLACGVLALDLSMSASLFAVATLGFGCGPIFPALIAATARRVPEVHLAQAVGVQVAAAALGQSMLPAGIGLLADAFSVEAIALALLASTVALWLCHAALERAAPVERASVERDAAGADPGAATRSPL